MLGSLHIVSKNIIYRKWLQSGREDQNHKCKVAMYQMCQCKWLNYSKNFHITEVYSADFHRCELILAQDLLSKKI